MIKEDSRLDLRNVTICAADSLNPRLASRALQISSAHCAFGDVVLFTHEDIDTKARIVRTPPITSRRQYSDFLLKDVIRHIHTPWILVVQWDGYVVDPSAWRAEFFEYDYIGARWPYHTDSMTVGNGGFSLRSAKLMRLIASDAFPLQHDSWEDELIGRVHRPILEAEHGIRFAPEEVADRFSHESIEPDGPIFGFHSPHNLHRYISGADLRELVRLAHPSTFKARAMVRLFAEYFFRENFAAAQTVYGGLRQAMGPDEIWNELVAFVRPRDPSIASVHDFARKCIWLSETAYGKSNNQRWRPAMFVQSP